MVIEELIDYLLSNVPNFQNPEIIENGECYHYTPHWDIIQNDGRFKGAPIDANLDITQNVSGINTPATEENGVVFGYENIEHVKEEGPGLQIVKIKYKKAISASQNAENSDDEMWESALKEAGSDIDPSIFKSERKNTILILAEDIIEFEPINN